MLKESSVYQAILAEGRVEGEMKGRVEARVETLLATLHTLGTQRFGPCPSSAEATLAQMSAEGLTGLVNRLLAVETWDELLAE